MGWKGRLEMQCAHSLTHSTMKSCGFGEGDRGIYARSLYVCKKWLCDW